MPLQKVLGSPVCFIPSFSRKGVVREDQRAGGGCSQQTEPMQGDQHGGECCPAVSYLQCFQLEQSLEPRVRDAAVRMILKSIKG